MDGFDHSWSTADPSIVAEISNALLSVGLPWLQDLHSYEALEAALAAKRGSYPPDVISLAVIRNELGDTSTACHELEVLMAGDPGGWRTRLEEVRNQLGCR